MISLLQHLTLSEILRCDHSLESYRAVLSYGAVYCAVNSIVVLAFESVSEILKCGHSNETYRSTPWCTVYFKGASAMLTAT